MKYRTWRRWLWLLPALLILAAAGFVLWAVTGPAPMPEALAALQSGGQVQVETEPWLVFRPATGEARTGLIFYPGGRVDPRAYAPLARAISAGQDNPTTTAGYLVVIVPMPLDLAVLDAGAAAGVIAAFPGVEHWAIGGHSLGGAMAALFAYDYPDAVEGLVLWAAYPAEGNDLSGRSLAVTSISATRDGLATPDKIEASRSLLPTGTRWIAIEGGNHAQFGWYGPQAGDNPATITREEQQAQVIAATLNLLSSLAVTSP